MWSNEEPSHRDSIRLDPVSDIEIDEAKLRFVEARSAELLKNNKADLFYELNGDETEILHKLYDRSIGLLGLAELQTRFIDRMNHEAVAMALREWSPTRETLARIAIQDSRCE